jgi:tetratricopeptide (TPR) repeat protein
MLQILSSYLRCTLSVMALLASLMLTFTPNALASTASEDVQTFTRWINESPTDATLYHGRGDAYLYLKEYRKAEADYSCTLKLNPKNANALYSRGLANSCLNKTHAALMDFGNTLTLSPNDADAHYNRGIVRTREGDVPGAMFDYTRAIELNPKHAYAYYNRGMLYTLWPTRTEQALTDLKQAEVAFTQLENAINVQRTRLAIQRIQAPPTFQATSTSRPVPTLR